MQQPSPAKPPATLAAAALPARVRQVLDRYLDSVAGSLGTRVEAALAELEQQLFREMESARSNDLQAERMADLHALRQRRSDLLPRLLAVLEAQLAQIRRRPMPAEATAAVPVDFHALSLVEDAAMEQDIALHEIVRRHEQRCGVPLLLLGQRFGVLAGAPALEPARVPAGPQSLCDALRAAAPALQLGASSRLLLYRAFEHRALSEYDHWLQALNRVLEGEGVLPGLLFAPRRAPTARAAATAAEAGRAAAVQRPPTDWHGQSLPSSWAALTATTAGATTPAVADAATGDHAAAFSSLQRLLSGRRAAQARQEGGTGEDIAGVPVARREVLSSLHGLQAQPVALLPGVPHRSVHDLREQLLAQARQRHGPHATLARQDADTLELLGLLYHEIEREVRPQTSTVELLVRLQAPVAQAALRDPGFFVGARHPARELLNAVAESGAVWLGADGTDPQLLQNLRRAVEQLLGSYDGDQAAFDHAHRQVQGHFQAAAHKAEVAERRHVEAARGRDRLETAKRRANDAIEAALAGKQPPRFVQALLKQAWADVLTLAQLRNGEDSPEWRQAQALTERIAALAGDAAAAGEANDPQLDRRIEDALGQVGYHADEAAAIARQLSGASREDDLSRTELAAKLKARGRLGEQGTSARAERTPRNPAEQQCYEYLRTLPYGTWFEFVPGPQGEPARRRLSWYSPTTDHTLFVNQRGQRVGEHSLDGLARLMAQGQVRVVTEDKGRLIDRAWQATLNALRHLAGGAKP